MRNADLRRTCGADHGAPTKRGGVAELVGDPARALMHVARSKRGRARAEELLRRTPACCQQLLDEALLAASVRASADVASVLLSHGAVARESTLYRAIGPGERRGQVVAVLLSSGALTTARIWQRAFGVVCSKRYPLSFVEPLLAASNEEEQICFLRRLLSGTFLFSLPRQAVEMFIPHLLKFNLMRDRPDGAYPVQTKCLDLYFRFYGRSFPRFFEWNLDLLNPDRWYLTNASGCNSRPAESALYAWIEHIGVDVPFIIGGPTPFLSMLQMIGAKYWFACGDTGYHIKYDLPSSLRMLEILLRRGCSLAGVENVKEQWLEHQAEHDSTRPYVDSIWAVIDSLAHLGAWSPANHHKWPSVFQQQVAALLWSVRPLPPDIRKLLVFHYSKVFVTCHSWA